MGGTLYLMRHGETVFNVQERIQGWVDSPLTEHGIEQARAAGRSLAEHGVVFDHAYCSTAERASDTLELVLEAMGQPLPYERMKALREHYHGKLEAESERLNRDVAMDEMDAFYRYFGGETLGETRDRVVPALLDIMERPEHENVLVVSHAGACMVSLTAFGFGEQIMAGGAGNGTIWVLDYLGPAADPADPVDSFALREIIPGK